LISADAPFLAPSPYETLEQTAVNAFGSVRQRIATHLLDLASAQQHPRGRLAPHVSRARRRRHP